MKRFFTLFAILIIWAVTAQGAIEPLRISITTNAISVATGAVATIDILDETGAPFTLAQTATKSVTTDAGGVASFVVITSNFANEPSYGANYLVRVTFDQDGTGSTYAPIVVSIERMEVIYSKQGLFGAKIDPTEIAPSSTNGQVLKTNGTTVEWATVAGLGTVTSVDLSVPSIFSVSGNPITGSGTLAVSLANRTDNYVFAGPTSGTAAPTFRALTDDDIPNSLTLTSITGPIAGPLVIGGETDNTTIEANGSVVHNGAATVWDDLRIQVLTRTAGTTPTFTTGFGGVGNTTIFTYNFNAAATNSVYFEVQMPHGWKEGSRIYPHVHWAPSTDNVAAGNVRWSLDYTWADVNGTFGASTTYTMDGAATANTQWKHYVTSGLAGIDATGKKISCMLICRLSRLGDDGADTQAGDACLLGFDIHFEKDMEGSRGQWNKATE